MVYGDQRGQLVAIDEECREDLHTIVDKLQVPIPLTFAHGYAQTGRPKR
jgi:hypothetical protein